MAPTTLYNKWRPRTFADPRDRPLVGQEPVARTLRLAIQRQQVAHAYLFCGPRGTGKTSAARIFARAINCLGGLQGEPCNRCANCTSMLDGRQLDLLVEIDAASNRGVEDARTLRERLLQRPGGDGLTGRYKVYIIDEVHMLTREAFNTLLKSLEEPPPHVIFILATTNPHEVLPTIVSRCQRFDFRWVPMGLLVAHLAHVASEEGMAVETRALETLSRAARGGLRDAIGLLDQSFAYAGASGADGKGTVTAAQVDAMLGLSGADAVVEVVRAIGDADLAGAFRGTHAALEGGADVRSFARQVIEALRAILLNLGGAPDAADLDPALRDVVALHARRFTLGRTIRAIKSLSSLEAGLRSRAADATLLFEVAIAEVISEATGASGSAVSQGATAATTPSRVMVPVSSVAPTRAPVVAGPVAAPGQGGGAASFAPTPAAVAETIVESGAAHSGPAGRPVAPAPTGAEIGFAASEELALAPRSSFVAVATGGEASATPIEPGAPSRGGAPVPAGAWPIAPRPEGASGDSGSRRTAPTVGRLGLDEVVKRWPEAIARVGSEGMAPVVGLLQGSQPTGIDPDGAIAVACPSTFHVQKLREPANQVGIERCAGHVLGVSVRLRFHVIGAAQDATRRRAPAAGVQDAFVARATRMLGGRALAPEEVEQLDRQATLPLDRLPG